MGGCSGFIVPGDMIRIIIIIITITIIVVYRLSSAIMNPLRKDEDKRATTKTTTATTTRLLEALWGRKVPSAASKKLEKQGWSDEQVLAETTHPCHSHLVTEHHPSPVPRRRSIPATLHRPTTALLQMPERLGPTDVPCLSARASSAFPSRKRRILGYTQ